MLTVNADTHELMCNYHRPGEEKRMVVILPEEAYASWLTASVNRVSDFLRHFPASQLVPDTGP